MLQTHLSFCETHLIGSRTKEWMVRAAQCSLFVPHDLTLIGWSEVRSPYCMIRPNPNCSHLLVCYGGSGKVWTEEGWQRLGADQAYLTSPGKPHAFQAEGTKKWSFAWAFYVQPANESPLFNFPGPIIKPVDATPFADMVRTIYQEVHGLAKPTMLHHLTEAFQQYVLRIRGSTFIDKRVLELTRLIESNLAYPWTAKELARRLHISEEHLRRLCLKHLNRSPINHLTSLRMQRACALLHSRDAKLETIAELVGYGSAFSLSSAFKRTVGITPTAYRKTHPSASR
jgi:AraC-like DNA-binding protein